MECVNEIGPVPLAVWERDVTIGHEKQLHPQTDLSLCRPSTPTAGCLSVESAYLVHYFQ